MNQRRESVLIIKYIQNHLKVVERLYPEVDIQILRSALVYQKLYKRHFKKYLYIQDILDEYNGEIGKIGPGDGCITNNICEKMFGSINICHMHSAFHDAYGRFYQKYKLDRGYTYALSENTTPSWLKNCALLGHITGIVWCIKNHSDLIKLF